MKVLRGCRTPQTRAPRNILEGCGKVAGMALERVFDCLPGFGSRGELQGEQRPSQELEEAPILLPERRPTLQERLQQAEAAAAVKLLVRTALTKAVQAEQKAAEQHAQQLQHQVNAEAISASQLKLPQAQHEDVLTELKALHEAQVIQLEQKSADAQKAAVEAVQAGTEAHLTQQQSTHEQALADCHTAHTNQVKQLSSLIAQHEASMDALTDECKTYQAQMEAEKQGYLAEQEQLDELEQQLAGLQGDLQTQQSKGLEVSALTSFDLRSHSAILAWAE